MADDHKADSEDANDASPEWEKSVARDYFEAIVIAVIFAIFVRTFVVQAFKIPSSSMEDSLLVGDHILVNKFAYGPRTPLLEKFLPYRTVEHGDVIVFKYPRDARRDFIKRMVGAGGDTIEVRRGHVLRNGEPLEEPFAFYKKSPNYDVDPQLIRASDNLRARRIPPDSFFMMGDNRNNSDDSRRWGDVPGSFVRGKALLIYWSFDVPDQYKPVEVGDATVAEKGLSMGYTLLHFFDKTRWRRTFKLIR